MLAGAEPAAARVRISGRLAEVEDRHVGAWRRLLSEQGHEVAAPAPSRRARFMAFVARRIGSPVLLPLLLEEEGPEGKGYLALYRDAPGGAAAPPALTLAPESKAHPQSLARLGHGGRGEPRPQTGA